MLFRSRPSRRRHHAPHPRSPRSAGHNRGQRPAHSTVDLREEPAATIAHAWKKALNPACPTPSHFAIYPLRNIEKMAEVAKIARFRGVCDVGAWLWILNSRSPSSLPEKGVTRTTIMRALYHGKIAAPAQSARFFKRMQSSLRHSLLAAALFLEVPHPSANLEPACGNSTWPKPNRSTN